MDERERVSYFALTNFRNSNRLFGIKQADRLHHMYIVGQTGVGKSTLIETLAIQDLKAGRGFGLIDPHGDLAERVWKRTPESLRHRITYLDASDPAQPYGYNPLRAVRPDKIALAVSGLLETLRKLWPDAWGMRMEHLLRNSLFALLERRDATLPDILKLYRDKSYRRSVVAGIRNETVRTFWKHEYESYPWRLRTEAAAPIQNKLGALLSDPMLRRTFVKPAVDLHFRSLMDEERCLLVNLARGQIGEDSALVLGSLLVSTIGLAAFTRADIAPEKRAPFFLYVDEFQNFTTLAFANMMSELRKYGVGLTLAHQHLFQLQPAIRSAVLGNVGSIVSFRIGPEDAVTLSEQFQPSFRPRDLLNLSNYESYVRLMIDAAPARPFSARTLSSTHIEAELKNRRQEVRIQRGPQSLRDYI